MALQMCASTIGRAPFRQIPLFRQVQQVKNHTGMKTLKDPARATTSQQSLAKDLHASTKVMYPEAKPIPLPNNIDEIDNSKLACFSPNRARDILGSVISSQTSMLAESYSSKSQNQQPSVSDPHVGSYDCNGAISLNSVMQSNVPEPFSSGGKSTHLNMPGGQWGQGQKYIAEDMQNLHYSKVQHQKPGNDGQVA